MLNIPARGLLPQFNISPVLFVNDKSNHAALIKGKSHADIGIDTHKNILLLLRGLPVVVQCKEGGLWIHGTVVKH